MTGGPRRVLFDGYWFGRGPIANRLVQREIVQAWASAFPHDDVVVALRGREPERAVDVPAGVRTVRTRLYPHALSNLVELGALARRTDADWVLSHNYTPWTRRRTLTFVHDVMFVDHPDWFSRPERAYFSLMVPTARRAGVIATSTDTEARRIRRATRARRPVVPVGLGVARTLTSAEPARPDGLDGIADFALCVGRLNVRKNLGAVVAAARESRCVTAASPLLVVGSAEHSGQTADLPVDVRELTDSGVVRFLGRVTDDELAWLYRNASVTAFLSRDEGFGLPVVEALTFGSPLVLSDIEVFREVAGDAARFVPLDASPRVVAQALDTQWGRPADASSVTQVLDRYTWAGCVARLRAALESVDI
ncbi:glycosyltransferase involved in cell wall biosynthesis [Sediminihabitans luteus]|uniref:Glycosyltransferase involved in cell wall biosynthesis n=1 Tax=Sediminihabitans luteus TaxID=1138585 RepID=A0A2M9CDA7_9CELL|nr:glycosyltransferase family 1 protein [Sediminihabitans luteus]PJJ69867.1 glycosyltransferase involved in cell wall biosynthesis [Sediminihabitans luteus]GII99186.1 hypothetical protein Slu03_15640 [Sediminihabitans luteus]